MSVEEIVNLTSNLQITPQNESENLVSETSEKENLKVNFKSLEIIFNWDPYILGIREKTFVNRLKEKIDEIIDDNQFKFRNFIIELVIIYEDFIQDIDKKNKQPLEELKKCENLLKDLKQKGCKEPLFLAVYEPLIEHIIAGSKSFMIMEYGMISEAKKALEKILTLEEMKSEQKAAIYCIKSTILIEYGSDYFRSALEIAKVGRDFDPSVAEWHFLVGKIISRIRHVEFTKKNPEREEILAFEKALSLDKNNFRYKVHLARSYNEKAASLFHVDRFDHNVEPLNRKVLQIYKEITMDPNMNDAQMLSRCALGITKLPYKMRDVPLALKAIEKARKLTPTNPLVLHYTGIIYDRHANRRDEAMIYYKKAADFGVFGAAMDLIRLKFTSNSNHNIVADLNDAAEKFLEKDASYQIMANISAYYFFIKHDIEEAWKHIEEIVHNDPQHSTIRKLLPIVLWLRTPFDFCEVLLDEVNKPSIKSEELLKIKDDLLKVMSSPKSTGYRRMKESILDQSKDLREGRKKPSSRGRPFHKRF